MNERKHVFYILVLLSALFSISVCCTNDEGTIFPSDFRLEEGDVVFRCGNEFYSQSIAYAQKNGLYSHVGIVVDSLGKSMIVHAVPDEHDYVDDVDRVKMDSINRFFSKKYAKRGCVCRPIDKSSAKRAASLAKSLYERKILFDKEYDIEDTTKMYCTELIVFVYEKCGIKLIGSEGHDLSFLGAKHKCIFPEDIYKSPQLLVLKSF